MSHVSGLAHLAGASSRLTPDHAPNHRQTPVGWTGTPKQHVSQDSLFGMPNPNPQRPRPMMPESLSAACSNKSYLSPSASPIRRVSPNPSPSTLDHLRLSSIVTEDKQNVMQRCTSPMLSRWEFEVCQKALKELFQRCTEFQFLRLATLISCLLSCLQPLHRSEISRLFTLLLGDGVETGNDESDESDDDDGDIDIDIADWLADQCEGVILIDVSGYFHFASSSLASFLGTVPIHGIDRSHQTMAKACLLDIESRHTVSRAGIPPQSDTRFASYTTRFWQAHYQRVEAYSPGLSARVHRLLTHSDLGDLGKIAPEIIEAAWEYCEEWNLQVLGDLYLRALGNGGVAACGGGLPPDPNRGVRPLPDSLRHKMAMCSIAGSESVTEVDWVIV